MAQIFSHFCPIFVATVLSPVLSGLRTVVPGLRIVLEKCTFGGKRALFPGWESIG